MGVKDLWKVLEPVREQVPSTALKGQTLAVDLSLWVCEAEGVSEMRGRVVKPYLRNLFFRVSHLTQVGVHLVFVVDGEAPDLKVDEMLRRQQARFPGRTAGRGKASAKTASRSHFKALLRECCEMLGYMGIPHIQSVGEAEALAALLNREGLVDGVITNDGDAFLYGARTVCRNFSMNKQESHVEMYRLSDIKRELNLDREKLVSLGLFLGCDYAPKGVPGVGHNTAMKYLAEIKGQSVMDRLWEWPSVRFEAISPLEENMRKKSLQLPVFPDKKVVNEFMKPRDKVPRPEDTVARRPKMFTVQKFLMIKLEWELDYAFEKILPLVTFYDLSTLKAGLKNTKCLKPYRIVKSCVRQFIPLYKVEWYKEERDDVTRMDYYVTLEEQTLFQTCFPHLVQTFLEELEKKGKKPRKPKGKPEEVVDDVTMVTRMESLSIEDDKPVKQADRKNTDAAENSGQRKNQVHVKSKTSSETKRGLSVKKSSHSEPQPETQKTLTVLPVKRTTGLEAVLGEIQNIPSDRLKETAAIETVPMDTNHDAKNQEEEKEETDEDEMLPLSQRLIQKVKESISSDITRSASTTKATDVLLAKETTKSSLTHRPSAQMMFSISSESEDELPDIDDVFMVEKQGTFSEKTSKVTVKAKGACYIISSSDEDSDERMNDKLPRKGAVKFDDSIDVSLLPTESSSKKTNNHRLVKFSFDDSGDISQLEPNLAHQISRLSFCELAEDDTSGQKADESHQTDVPRSTGFFLDFKQNSDTCKHEEPNFSLGLGITFNASGHSLGESFSSDLFSDADLSKSTDETDRPQANGLSLESRNQNLENNPIPVSPKDDGIEENMGILSSKNSSRIDSIEKCRETGLDVSCASSLDCSAFLPLDVTLIARSKGVIDSQSSESPHRSPSLDDCDETLVIQGKPKVMTPRDNESETAINRWAADVRMDSTDDGDLTIAIAKDIREPDYCKEDNTLIVQYPTHLPPQRVSTDKALVSEMDTQEMDLTIALQRPDTEADPNQTFAFSGDKQTASSDVTLMLTDVHQSDGGEGVTDFDHSREPFNNDAEKQMATKGIGDTTIAVRETWSKERLEDTINVDMMHLVEEMALDSKSQETTGDNDDTIMVTGLLQSQAGLDETIVLRGSVKRKVSLDATLLMDEKTLKLTSMDETLMLNGLQAMPNTLDQTIMINGAWTDGEKKILEKQKLTSMDETLMLNGLQAMPNTLDETVTINGTLIDGEMKVLEKPDSQIINSGNETIFVSESCKLMSSADDTIMVNDKLCPDPSNRHSIMEETVMCSDNLFSQFNADETIMLKTMDKQISSDEDMMSDESNGDLNNTLVVNSENLCFLAGDKNYHTTKSSEVGTESSTEDALLVNQSSSSLQLINPLAADLKHAEEDFIVLTEAHAKGTKQSVDVSHFNGDETIAIQSTDNQASSIDDISVTETVAMTSGDLGHLTKCVNRHKENSTEISSDLLHKKTVLKNKPVSSLQQLTPNVAALRLVDENVVQASESHDQVTKKSVGSTPIARRTRRHQQKLLLQPITRVTNPVVTKTTGRIKTGHKHAKVDNRTDMDEEIIILGSCDESEETAKNIVTRSRVKQGRQAKGQEGNKGHSSVTNKRITTSRHSKASVQPNVPKDSRNCIDLTIEDNSDSSRESRACTTRQGLSSSRKAVETLDSEVILVCSNNCNKDGKAARNTRQTRSTKTRQRRGDTEMEEPEAIVVSDSPVRRRVTRNTRSRGQQGRRKGDIEGVILID